MLSERFAEVAQVGSSLPWILLKNINFLPSLKSAWDLVYLGQNCDVREILRNVIGCLED